MISLGARETAAAAAKRRHPDVESFLSKVPLPARVLSSELRALVHSVAQDARENLCYGVPFFFVHEIAFCYVSPAKAHVTFGFTMGDEIRNASGGLRGTGKSPIRKATLKLDAPVPEEARVWIEQAAALARAS